MRQVWITRAGAPEVLQVREAPDPEPGDGQVRIRVKAAGINFADLMARVGLYPDAPKIPCVVGYEVSGVVDRVGAGVTGLHEGDRVFGMPKFGGYTDCLAVAEDQVFRMPERMTFEEAAALPVVYLTAYNMMLFTGALRPGSTVLIHSAAGGVGRDREDPRLHPHRHGIPRQARLSAAAGRRAPHRLTRRLCRGGPPDRGRQGRRPHPRSGRG
jgi:NADPH:quinone reductase-like Zn-dependent oxidoreductase